MIFTDLFESPEPCPECGGVSFSDLVLAEKHDACYNKVRSRYKVWPSAYASGALVQCRKKGAANWGNKSKNESMAEGRDMCHVCGQTPCNCTHLNEAVANPGHRLIELFNLIYSNGGDDAVDYLLYNSPIFADYYDQYEGDLESIAAEVDAKELQVMVNELEEVAENEGLAEGWREKLAGAALAGAMTFGGAGKAMANDAPVNPDQDRPAVTQVQKQKVDMEKVYQLDQKMQDTNPKYAQERAQLPPMVRGIGPAASARNEKVWNMVADLLVKYGQRVNESMSEGLGQNLSVQQLATISDEALDKAYGYGRSTPGNTFGWQANLMSAAYAKKMIDAGVTDIEAISDAIHKGWNVTAQKFVQNPDQFDDTEKLRQAGKLDAKLQQRAKLMKINYAQLDNEEQEKDRVVARALLQAIKGQQSVAEGADDNILDEAAPWVDKLGLGNFFRKIKNVDADNQKEIRILSGVNHSMQLYFKTILALNAQAGPAASLFWPLLGKQALLFAGGAAAYTIGKILATKLGRALFGSTEEALAWAQAHLAAGKNKESKFEFDGKQYPVTVVDPASIANLEQQIAQLEGIVTNKQSRAAKAEYQKSLRQSKKVYQGVAEGERKLGPAPGQATPTAAERKKSRDYQFTAAAKKARDAQDKKGVAEGLNEFAPDGFNSGGDGSGKSGKGPKARAKAQMIKAYGPGIITFRKTSNGGYFIQHEDDFGDTNSHQYDPQTGKVDFSGVTRSSYYGEGVAEGSNDTVYPNAEIIKSKNGKPVGEIYQDGNEWGCFHYRADRGYDMIDSREDAIQALKDLHSETGRSRPDYTIKGVAEGYTPSAGELAKDLRKMSDSDFSKKYGMSKQHYSSSKLKEQGVAEGSATMWEVSFDYGPHMTKTVKVKAGSKQEAKAKVEKAAEKSYTRGIMINWVKPVGQGVAEGLADTKRLEQDVRDALENSDDEDPLDNYPCYDCGSTIFLHHTKLCELAEPNAKHDLPSKPRSQHWTGEIPKGLHPIPGLEEGVSEMDKSQPSHGRDGRISHSTYGSRDRGGSTGPERTARMTTVDKMMKDAYKEMMKSMSNTEKADKGWRNPNMDEGSGLSDRTLIGYLTKVAADAQKHPADPTKRSPEKASRSVGGFAQAFNKLDARKGPVNEISPEGPDSDEDYREWERLKDVRKQPYSPDWDDDDEKFMQKWYQERGLEETTDQEADYGKSYQDMVKRMGAKAREQEQTRPVDISDLARRLRDIEKKSGN